MTTHDSNRQGNTALYIPENLHLESVLPSHLKRYQDGAAWLIDQIFKGTHLANRAEEDGYVPLKAAYLRKVIPDRILMQMKQCLLDQQIIETDNHYVVGQKSIGYRLGPQYRESSHRRCPISDPKIIERVNQLRRGDLSRLSDVHHYLFKQFEYITWDVHQMFSIIDGLADRVDLDTLQKHSFLASQRLAAEQLINHDWVPTVCQYGRYHSPLTRIVSECRSCLRINDQVPVNLDIANSQPLFLGLLLLEKTNNPEKAPQPIAQGQYGRSPIVYDEYFSPDVAKYLQLTQEGVLYDRLSRNSHISRREFKEKLFQDVYYGHNWIHTDLTDVFEQQFPTIYEFIRQQKKNNYKRLSWLMQKAESRFMLNGVCTRLMNDHSEIVILTIHDSIMTTPEHAHTVKIVMLDEFRKVGLQPTIRTESYRSSVSSVA